MKKTVATQGAPQALGPYSQGLRVSAAETLYCSGQVGINPQTGDFAGEQVEVQAKQALENIKAIVTAAGFEVAEIVKMTVFMTEITDFKKVNEVYADFFKEVTQLPARSAVGVQALPADAKVEIEAFAVHQHQ
ncbi:Rid family detoxifying hydrolase [Liquorilactobacillus satsumensis]|uniref:Uncharacterized protein n=2 Tax=Liquorilactobacillus satsumensis TaxID=259059 RepID=A0A0R1V1S2_9LACO|nr:Rid family detoxifying hydrolase [Liquorilactobacillus satsumensis]KRL96709.1 hypothetical protein FD50_GL001984 [Liquorilactobacillus satsumensis DSM 16230 = JCM 12392]MCC7666054.1 reactive intermediate/imine deaminase [Liquorilactobacillus satsumensis]MCP9313043.1 Rid family detoxifying hydrolase [Liquorilactobacillus satsumensis]MCP9328810.1 Rid family detoxifying hydrolase [Liquorilactobacillus satsumensis]MCP9356840.1 Rid family detoxifying hydrolase [Liquorilactobacillus satsumensis]